MIFSRKEMKTEARQALKGNFWKVALVGFLLVLIPSILSEIATVNESSILSFIIIIVSLLTTATLDFICQTWYRQRNEAHFDHLWAQIANHFKNYWVGSLLIGLLIMVWIALWTIPAMLLVVLGLMTANVVIIFIAIILASCLVLWKGLQYSQAFFLYRDAVDQKQTFSYNQFITQSKQLMKGHCWEFFVLQVSFILWFLLCIVTFGIGFVWVTPYISCTRAAFYQRLINQ